MPELYSMIASLVFLAMAAKRSSVTGRAPNSVQGPSVNQHLTSTEISRYLAVLNSACFSGLPQ